MSADDYGENESKLMRKAKENPFVPVGEYLLYLHGYIIISLSNSLYWSVLFATVIS